MFERIQLLLLSHEVRAAWRRARRFDEARIRNNKPTESLKQKKTKSQTMAMSLLMRYHTFQAAVEHNDELSHTVTKKQRLHRCTDSQFHNLLARCQLFSCLANALKHYTVRKVRGKRREAYLWWTTGWGDQVRQHGKRSRERDNYVSKDYTLKSTRGDGGTRVDQRRSRQGRVSGSITGSRRSKLRCLMFFQG